eukprot:TRINITY_DN5067_c0_g2_i14.p1 TRINITY_DN5067_c0_g2~~TRINITY_DN5067_c0_g2_i14.p1  ORF type:complete len:182 (-),score=47.54 TRINITY_DN5067_c0_g2_i14:31-576(-)
MVRTSNVDHSDLERSDMEEAVVRLQTILDTDHTDCPEANDTLWTSTDMQQRVATLTEVALLEAQKITDAFNGEINKNTGSGKVSEASAQQHFQIIVKHMDSMRTECALGFAALSSVAIREICSTAQQALDNSTGSPSPDDLASYVRHIALCVTQALTQVSNRYTEGLRSIADTGKPVIDGM